MSDPNKTPESEVDELVAALTLLFDGKDIAMRVWAIKKYLQANGDMTIIHRGTAIDASSLYSVTHDMDNKMRELQNTYNTLRSQMNTRIY